MQEEQISQRLEGFDPRHSFKNVPLLQPGTGDFIVGGDTLQILGRMAAYYMGFSNGDGCRYIRGVTVIAPPQMVWSETDETIHLALVRGMEDVHGGTMSPDVVSRFLTLVKVIRCEQLGASEINNQIAMTGERHVVLIPHANKYRDHELTQEWALGRSGTLLSEDIWVPHAVRVAAACLTVTRPLGSVVVFSVTDESLVKESNLQLLTDVADLYPGILGDEAQSNTDDLLAEIAPRLAALATAGRMEQALNELEQAALSDSAKQQLALHVAARAGDAIKTLSLLREHVLKLNDLSGEVAARFGKMAYTSGDAELARKFFVAALDKLSDQMLLEATLGILTSMVATALIERCWTRLQTLFPHSNILEENRECRLLQMCDTAGAPRELATSSAGFEEFHTYMAEELRQNRIADYKVLYEQIRLRWSHRVHLAAICIALHALGQKNFVSAIEFAIMATKKENYEPYAVRVLLGALRRMFLLEVRPAEGLDAYKIPLLFILHYLARHPNETRLRADLNSTLSVETAGSVGLPIMASIALNITSQGIQLEEITRPDIAPVEQAQFNEFFENALQWMSEQQVIEPGVTRLPAGIVGDDADRLIENLKLLLQFAAHNLDTAEDLHLFEICAHMVCLLQPYASSVSADLAALRLLGAKYWLHGQPQRARNIAEQVLSLAGESPERQRLAWGNYADIYSRTRNPVDALIGLTCAATLDTKLEAADLFQEAYTLLRVTRDLHLYDIARAVLPGCRHLYEIQELGELGQQRLDGIEIGLDVAQSGTLDEPGLFALLERTRVHCETVMAARDELLPAASQFMQVAGGLERAGKALPAQVVALRESLKQRLGAETATFLNAISVAFPSIEEVVWLHNRLGAALNSEDTSSDQLSVVMAAHRLLLPRTPDISVKQAVVAVELLSDRSLEIDSPALPLVAQWPIDFILALSQADIGVLMLATDSNGEVVVVLAENSELRVVRPDAKERNFVGRLHAWSAKYPYRYGLIERDEGNGEFYASMEEFDLPMPNTKQVLVVAEPTLQQLAFNLLLVNGEFAGESKAIGLAPSLTWFDSSRKRPPTKYRERLAWISCAPESEAYGTLEMLFARLGPVFKRHGFKTDITGKIPKNLAGTSLAVVTAHGGLTSERRYIHSIADEQELTESPLALARALAGVDVVILFVCSGGRVDRHPLSNTTVSLPKMLLDRGCRAVLASPWPLSAVVPGNWLERFMEAWESGDSILQANFRANQYVQERLGPEPGLALAMMAYGDVLLTRNTDFG